MKLLRITLMNKNHPVIDFDYNQSTGIIEKIYEVNKYAPLGIKNKEDLQEWLENRSVPYQRLKNALNIDYGQYDKFITSMIKRTHGFNLSDQYFFKLQDEQISWHEKNLFTNDFEESKLKSVFSNPKKHISPSSSTNGNLSKVWKQENNLRYLYKGSSSIAQEPYNELIATKLYERVLKSSEYVSYELTFIQGKPYSKCTCFIDEFTEFVPALHIIKVLSKDNRKTNYQHFLDCTEYLKIKGAKDFMNKMLTCDYILGNSDRHYNNFGAIRDVRTLKFISMAPIFDTGNSLGILKQDETELTTYPFYKDPEKQLSLVDDFSWLDISKLEGFINEAKEILTLNKNISEYYISHSIEEMEKRIEYLKRKIAK